MGEVYNKIYQSSIKAVSTIEKIAGRLFVFRKPIRGRLGFTEVMLQHISKDLDPEIHEIVNRRFWDMVS